MQRLLAVATAANVATDCRLRLQSQLTQRRHWSTDRAIAANHRLQRSGEADVFEVVNQLSPPAEPYRYFAKDSWHLNFEAYWQAEFPACPAIPYLLRDAYPERWVRFHSLPNSKRYAENEAEYRIILHRHNTVLDYLAKQDAPLLFISTEFGETTNPIRADSPLVELDSSARCIWTFKADPDDDENYYRHLFLSDWKWIPGIFDSILRLVADWKIVDTMVVSTDRKWIFHPYDGGADFILPNPSERDELKSCFSDWLSRHPRGL